MTAFCCQWTLLCATAFGTGVLLMQMLPFADAQAMALFGAFERAVYAAVSA